MWRNVGGEKVRADAQVTWMKKKKTTTKRMALRRFSGTEKKILIFNRNGALSIIRMSSIIKVLKLLAQTVVTHPLYLSLLDSSTSCNVLYIALGLVL
jgi:hypothetical protein